MNTINTIMINTIRQIDNNTIQITRDGTLIQVMKKIIPGCTNKNYVFYGVTIKDLSSYVKYKGEHYA